ncbi:MAG: DUF2206 domain-containing protein [Candidatus Jordarchaeaceae archaeon]
MKIPRRVCMFNFHIFVFQIVFLIIMSISLFGLELPFIRQIVVFTYLTFLPGFLFLRIIKVKGTGTIEIILFSVGLSLSFLMIIGLLVNVTYPILGFHQPLSIMPLTVTIIIVTGILYILNCFMSMESFDKGNSVSLKLKPVPLMTLLLLPFLSVLGACILTYYHSSFLLAILIIIISLVTFLATLDIGVPKRYYILLVYSIGVALLFHKTLISEGLVGVDVRGEYSLAYSVASNGYWDHTSHSFSINNSLLSISILPVIYSILMNISLIWMFKLIYPIFFSLVPVGLYYVFREQSDEKTAFLSAFFFMSLHTFFMVMPSTTKQMIAEVFLSLIILLMVNKRISSLKKRALSIVFAFSMIVSHYGISYLFMLTLIPVLLLLKMLKSIKENYENLKHHDIMTKTFVGLFFVMSIAWYIYVSNATTFESFVLIGNHIYNSIYAEFFELESREGAVRKLLGLEPALSIWRQIGYGYYLLTQFFILVGLLALVRALVKGKRYLNFNDVHVAFSFVNVLWLAAALLPHFSSYMGISRLYHVMLFFLSPFCILGGKAFFKYTLKKVKSIQANRRMLDSILIFAVLLPYFFFSTGLVFEVVGD